MFRRVGTAVEHNLLRPPRHGIDDDRRHEICREIADLLAREREDRIDHNLLGRGKPQLLLHIIVDGELVVRKEGERHRHEEGEIRGLHRLQKDVRAVILIRNEDELPFLLKCGDPRRKVNDGFLRRLDLAEAACHDLLHL